MKYRYITDHERVFTKLRLRYSPSFYPLELLAYLLLLLLLSFFFYFFYFFFFFARSRCLPFLTSSLMERSYSPATLSQRTEIPTFYTTERSYLLRPVVASRINIIQLRNCYFHADSTLKFELHEREIEIVFVCLLKYSYQLEIMFIFTNVCY